MNKKKMYLTIGLFLVLFLISYNFLNYKEKERENAEALTKAEAEINKESESVSVDQNVTESEENTDTTETEQDKNESEEYSEEELKEIEPELEVPEKTDFKIELEALNDEVKKLIGGNEDKLKEQLASFLYQYNYLTVTKATFLGEISINYNESTVKIHFYLDDEVNSKLEATYYTDTQEFTFATYY